MKSKRGEIISCCLGCSLALMVLGAAIAVLLLIWIKPDWLPRQLDVQEMVDSAQARLPGNWSTLTPISGRAGPYHARFQGDGFQVWLLDDQEERPRDQTLRDACGGREEDQGYVDLHLADGPALALWKRFSLADQIHLVYSAELMGAKGAVRLLVFGPQEKAQSKAALAFLASLRPGRSDKGGLKGTPMPRIGGDLTLDKVGLGAPIALALSQLGQPDSQQGSTYNFLHPELTLQCRPDGTIYRMRAAELRRGDTVLARVGSSYSGLEGVAGRTLQNPLGAGSWSLFHGDKAVYEIDHDKGLVTAIWATLIGDAPAAPPPSAGNSPGATATPREEKPSSFQPVRPEQSQRRHPPYVPKDWVKSPADYPSKRPLDPAGPRLAVNLASIGMTRGELDKTLGPPSKVKPFGWEPEGQCRQRLEYWDDRTEICTVILAPDGKVLSVEGNALTQGDRILLLMGRSDDYAFALNLGPESEHFCLFFGPGSVEQRHAQDYCRRRIFLTDHEILVLNFEQQYLHHIMLLSRQAAGGGGLDFANEDFRIDGARLGMARSELEQAWTSLKAGEGDVVEGAQGARARLEADRVVALEGDELRQGSELLARTHSGKDQVALALRLRQLEHDELALWRADPHSSGLSHEVGYRSYEIQTRQGRYKIVAPTTEVSRVYATAYRARSLEPGPSARKP